MAKNANFETRYAATNIESDGKTYALDQVITGIGPYGRMWGSYSGSDFIVVKLRKRRGTAHAYAFYTYTKPPAKKKPTKKK